MIVAAPKLERERERSGDWYRKGYKKDVRFVRTGYKWTSDATTSAPERLDVLFVFIVRMS